MVMQQKLNDGEMENIPGLENTNDLQPNQPCVAQFSEDNRWYRVLTVHIIDEEHIEVRFVATHVSLFSLALHDLGTSYIHKFSFSPRGPPNIKCPSAFTEGRCVKKAPPPENPQDFPTFFIGAPPICKTLLWT